MVDLGDLAVDDAHGVVAVDSDRVAARGEPEGVSGVGSGHLPVDDDPAVGKLAVEQDSVLGVGGESVAHCGAKLSKSWPSNTASTSLQLSRPATPWPHRISLVGVSTQELFYRRADVVARSTVSQFDQGCLSDHGDPQLRALHRMSSPQSVEVCLAFFGELGVATTDILCHSGFGTCFGQQRTDSALLQARIEVDARPGHQSVAARWEIARRWVENPILSWFPIPDLIATGELRLPFGDQRLAPIAGYDVAELCANILRDPATHVGKAYTLVGPELKGIADFV